MVEISISGRGPQGQPSQGQRSRWQAAYDRADAQRAAMERSEDKAYRARDAQVAAADRLTHALSSLEKRLSQPLRPSTFSTGMRAIDALEFRNQQHRARHGYSPINAGQFSSLRTGMADEKTAHRTANILRLGSLGQKAAEQRSYSELVKIERELKRIDKSTAQQAKFQQDPAARARVQRLENAMVQARSRISSGLEGTPRATMALGKFGGSMMNIWRDPFARTAIDIAGATIGLPYALNRGFAGILGMQRPFLDFSMASKAFGRAGGFASADLLKAIYPSGAGSFIPMNGMHRSAQMRALGLGPLDVLKNLQGFGVTPGSAGEALDIASSIRRQFIGPGGFGLGEDTLAKVLGTGRELGAAQGGGAFQQSSNKYWNAFEKAVSAGVGSGVDRSRMAQIFIGLQTNAANSGALGSSADSAARFMERMLSSGAPGARNGSDILSAAGNIDKAAQGLGIGGNMPLTMLFGDLMQRKGLPKTEDQLRQFLGVSKEDWARNYVNTPAGQQALSDFLSASRAGAAPFAMSYLGTLLSGHPDVTSRLVENDPLFRSLPPYMQGLARASALQMPLSQSMELGSTMARPGNAPGANSRQRAALEAGRLQRDLGLTAAQAAGFAGVLQGEGLTTGNEYGKPFGQGGYGIAQWTGSRRKRFFAWVQAQGLDPSSYEAQQAYIVAELKSQYPEVLAKLKQATTPEEAANAAMGYEFGDGSSPASARLYAAHADERRRMAGQVYADIQGNSPVAELNKGADQQTATLKGAEYISTISDTVSATFNKIAASGESVATAFAHAAAAAEHFAKGLGGGGSASAHTSSHYGVRADT